ncbi:Replication protein A 70 kDa DNA-binding subunit [Orchesella cincta]|uniref:Replication protein A subunit n=1 Tax=Orchesella cincta TaxID=48709 RepID=A0A1D2NB27_ORCCI|nr:Replication protein A 70 kDa DNA-binding subunit [Orchesella cincta]
MDIKLSTGAVATLMKGGEVDKPVFQILGFKKIAGQGGNDRFRLNISDGLHSHTFAMLATQLNHMIPEGELDNNCIIRAEKLISNAVSEKRVLIILDLTVLAKGNAVGVKLGNPVQYAEQNGNAAGAVNGGKPNGSDQTDTKPAVKPEFTAKPSGAFYGQGKPTSVLKTSPHKNNASFSGMNASDCVTIPIRDITPYGSKSAIKARVTNKSVVRTWSNSRGDGKLFSIDLLDDSGEVRMTGFNTAVDAFYDLIKVNEVYTFSKFSAKPANKQFTSLNHEYEISFVNDTSVIPCMDTDSDSIPTLSFQFMEIAFIESCENNKMIDVVAVCKSRGDVHAFTSKTTNKDLKKREVTLVDRTNTEIVLTLWGKQAEDFEDDTNPVIAVKGVKVSDFGGKSLSMMNSSVMMINPDIPEAHILRGWYDNEGMNVPTKSLVQQRGSGGGANAPWKMVREASTVDPSSAESGYYFRSKVTILAIKRENALYKACPEERCNKKVMDCNNGMWRCEKCNKEHPDFKWRLILHACFGDSSDSIWATCFQEHGELVLDSKSDVLGPLNEEQDAFDGIIKKAVFKSYTAKFRAKMEVYNNENRLKYTVMELNPINYGEYAQKLLAEIKENVA